MDGSSSEISRTAKSGTPAWVKIVIGIVLVASILVAAAILTLTVTVQPPVDGADYPYSANYAVSLPEGQQVTVGNEVISVLSYQNELVTDVNGVREKLILGESRQLSERGAKITALGIPVIQTNFQISLRYRGEQNNRAYFTMTIRTQRQVPECVLNGLLPSSIAARPL